MFVIGSGTSFNPVAIEDYNVIGSGSGGYRLNSSGAIEESVGFGWSSIGTWLLQGSAGDYDVRATLSSGSATGTFGSWLALSTTRAWNTTSAATIVIEIRSSGVVRDTATITLSA